MDCPKSSDAAAVAVDCPKSSDAAAVAVDCPKSSDAAAVAVDCPKRCDAEAVVVLPDDPLLEILSRLPVKSLCRFKCVSKAWGDLIADPHHRKKLPQTLEGFFVMFDQGHCESDSCSDDCDSGEEDGEDCHNDDKDGEGCDGDDGGGEDCNGGDRDGQDCSADGSDGEESPCQGYGFVDVLGTSVRPVDFSFLTELGSIKKSKLLHCCNGLLLFVVDCNSDISDSYIVCNPATKQYVPVPSNSYFHINTWDCIGFGSLMTYLIFEPGVSSHFRLVEFWQTMDQSNHHIHLSVFVYSSETHAWSYNKRDLDYRYQTITPNSPNAYVNGMLHLIFCSGKDHLAAVDVEGNKQKIFPLPCRSQYPLYEYVGQSHGCLHFICHERKIGDHGLSIWVLQDYDRQQWVLKDTVSYLKLFGIENFHWYNDYKVVGIHPDHSLVFFVQDWDRKLISYNMDSKEVRDLCTLRHGYKRIIPYLPYFSEFGA